MKRASKLTRFRRGKGEVEERVERRGCWLGKFGTLSYGLGAYGEVLLTDEERKNFERVKGNV